VCCAKFSDIKIDGALSSRRVFLASSAALLASVADFTAASFDSLEIVFASPESVFAAADNLFASRAVLFALNATTRLITATTTAVTDSPIITKLFDPTHQRQAQRLLQRQRLPRQTATSEFGTLRRAPKRIKRR
jgi:hypothetical protein